MHLSFDQYMNQEWICFVQFVVDTFSVRILYHGGLQQQLVGKILQIKIFYDDEHSQIHWSKFSYEQNWHRIQSIQT